MARVIHARFPRWSLGLALATLGLILALFAYTGQRVYNLVWFYVALAGFVAVVIGVVYVGWDRAIRPEVERRRKRGLRPPPKFRERARSLLDETDVPARTGTKAETVPKPKGKVERVRMACPSCTHVFHAEGVRPIGVSCPRCGLEGELP